MNFALIALAVAAATPTPAPSLTPDSVASPGVTATPAAALTPVGTAAPQSPAVATGAPATYAYRFVPRQPPHLEPGVPQIFAVYLNSDRLASNGPFAIKVATSPDVVKVSSGSGDRRGIVPRVTAGDFEATSTLPKLPFIASGATIDLEVVATGTTGKRTSVKVPLKLK